MLLFYYERRMKAGKNTSSYFYPATFQVKGPYFFKRRSTTTAEAQSYYFLAFKKKKKPKTQFFFCLTMINIAKLQVPRYDVFMFGLMKSI